MYDHMIKTMSITEISEKRVYKKLPKINAFTGRGSSVLDVLSYASHAHMYFFSNTLSSNHLNRRRVRNPKIVRGIQKRIAFHFPLEG